MYKNIFYLKKVHVSYEIKVQIVAKNTVECIYQTLCNKNTQNIQNFHNFIKCNIYTSLKIKINVKKHKPWYKVLAETTRFRPSRFDSVRFRLETGRD